MKRETLERIEKVIHDLERGEISRTLAAIDLRRALIEEKKRVPKRRELVRG